MLEEVWEKGNYYITTNKEILDINAIFNYLSNTYWGQNRNLAQVKKSIQHCLCFGLFEQNQQIGFTRVLSDCTITSYLFDVYILPTHQHLGLGRWLIETILAYPAIKETTIVLVTKDKQGFYQKFGFEPFAHPDRIMVLSPL